MMSAISWGMRKCQKKHSLHLHVSKALEVCDVMKSLLEGIREVQNYILNTSAHMLLMC